LISSGRSPEESGFLDASASGADVFFTTAARLAAQDFDTSADVYDAHECTVAVPCFAAPATVPPPCESADSFKAAPSAQPEVFGAPASATFSGAGNASTPKTVVRPLTRPQKLTRALKACHSKHSKPKRKLCEKRARASFGPVKPHTAAKKGKG
jgi:hypothetical protein